MPGTNGAVIDEWSVNAEQTIPVLFLISRGDSFQKAYGGVEHVGSYVRLLSFDLIQVHKEILNLALEAWKCVFTGDQVFFAHDAK